MKKIEARADRKINSFVLFFCRRFQVNNVISDKDNVRSVFDVNSVVKKSSVVASWVLKVAK